MATYSEELDCHWVLWYHQVDDPDWSLESYKRLAVLACLEDYHAMLNTLPDITAGMFFLMREGVAPMWEDPANNRGGYMSFRVLTDCSNNIWQDLTAHLVMGTLTKRPGAMDSVTGISFSPKVSNSIFRVWIGSGAVGIKEAKSVIINTIPNFSTDEAIFKRYAKGR